MGLLLLRNKFLIERRDTEKQRRVKGGDTFKVSPPFYFILVSLLLSLLSFPTLSAQEINLGIPIIQEKLPEGYSYNPLFLTARFPLFDQKEKRLQYYIEPQLAISFPPKGVSTAFEFGSNLGLQYRIWEGKKQHLQGAVGVGPHYTSLETSIQHKGFLFSDNIEVAYYQQVQPNWGFQIKGRFRHLSNANLFKPNKGLDNLFLMVGINWRKEE